eukprot:164358_1
MAESFNTYVKGVILGNFKQIADKSLLELKQTDDDTFIIGAGFPRTGTSSLQVALVKLGYYMYHSREIWKNKDDRKYWTDVGRLKHDLKLKHDVKSFESSQWNKTLINFDWNKIFNNTQNGIKYNGTMDCPGCSFYIELMKYYNPNYKVILSVRDSPSSWYQSIKTTIFPIMKITYRSWFLFYIPKLLGVDDIEWSDKCIWDLIFDKKFDDEQYVINKYNEWIKSVKQQVPKDKLLIFNVKDGWSPLCTFLGKSIPNEEFPWANDKEDMKTMYRAIKSIAIISDVMLIGGIVGVLYFAYTKFKKRFP